MENEKRYLFNVIASVLKGSSVLYLMDDLDYAVLFELAEKQGLTGFLCTGLAGIYLPEKLASAYERTAERQRTAAKDYEMLTAALRESGIDFLPIGGAALRGLYSEPILRESRDMDVLIKPDDREKARLVLEKSGFSRVRECEFSDFYFKSPATRIALTVGGKHASLWDKAVAGKNGMALSPEDRYVDALFSLHSAIDEGRGQAKLLVDLFVLNFAFDHVFDRNYICSETDRLGLGYFETQVNDLYAALFLEKTGATYDIELFNRLFDEFPKALPPRYLSPEKRRLLRTVRIVLFSALGVASAAAITAMLMLFNNKYTDRPEPSAQSGEVSDASSEVPVEPDYISFGEGEYFGELSDGLPDGQGKMEYYSGDVYTGSFRAGKRDGYGVYYLGTGGRYEGEFSEGSMTGEGTFYYTNGNVVTGYFEEGLPNGSCKFMYSDGSVYDGEMKDGVREGNGVFTYENGDVYTGSFVGGVKSGKGRYVWKNGSVFDGEWSENTQKSGIFTDAQGKYTGPFVNGKFEGDGIYAYANGDIYTGEFINGAEHDDNGELVYKNGDKYNGAFRNGVFSGNGTVSYASGDIVTGKFVNGKLEGEARYYFAKQKLWQTVVYKNGDIIEYKEVIY